MKSFLIFTLASGSASANVDFTPVSGTLTFASGEIAKTVDVLVTGDMVAELSENFVVVLSNPVQASIDDAIGIGLIINDDDSCGIC